MDRLCVYVEMRVEKCVGLTNGLGSFQGDKGQQWDSFFLTAHSLPDPWIAWHLFVFVYEFGKSEDHLSSISIRKRYLTMAIKITVSSWKGPAQIVLCQQLCNLYKYERKDKQL